MVIFKPEIPIWVNFGGPYIEWKMLTYFMAIWNTFASLSIMYKEKSGNPVTE
jgi:hypothetical protein